MVVGFGFFYYILLTITILSCVAFPYFLLYKVTTSGNMEPLPGSHSHFTQVELLQDCSLSSSEKLFKSRYKKTSKSTDFSVYSSKRSLVSFKKDSILFSCEVLKGQEEQWSLMVAGHEAAFGERRMGRMCPGMGGNKVDTPLLPQNQRFPIAASLAPDTTSANNGSPFPTQTYPR